MMTQQESGVRSPDSANAAPDPIPGGMQARQRSTLLYQRLADAGLEVVNWEQLAAADDFRALLAARIRFILPATAFFVAYYLALPLLVGYAPGLMKTQVIGAVNLAYLFALSQFLMAWILAYLFIRRCRQFDAMVHAIVVRTKRPGRRS